MPRIRSVKPEFWDSPGTAQASLRARLFYIAMWNWADDYGIGTANPKQLIGFAFPNDEDVTVADFPRLRTEVSECYGTVWYEVDGRPYFAIPTWDEHQKNERRAKGRHPGPDLGKRIDTEMHGDSAQCVGSSGTGTGEHRNRGTGDSSSEVASATSDQEITRPEVEHLCSRLADRIEANGSKRPTITKRWRDACRLMLDNDGRTVEQIEYLIDWSQHDEFWRGNVLSMPKLREKFDQLRIKATGQTNGTTSRRQQQVDGVYERAMQRANSGETL